MIFARYGRCRSNAGSNDQSNARLACSVQRKRIMTNLSKLIAIAATLFSVDRSR